MELPVIGTRPSGSLRSALPALLLALTCCGDVEKIPPDVVLIVVDTLRADRLGLYGYERPTSPCIDALAERAIVFEQSGVQHKFEKKNLHLGASQTLLCDFDVVE